MHLYLVTDSTDPETVAVHATRGDAQAMARDAFKPVFRAAARIVLIDVNTDKASLVWLLNNTAKLPELATEGALRTWRLTARGGIKEIL